MEIFMCDFTEEKKEDSPLDSVIMSPEMLICPDNDKNKEKTAHFWNAAKSWKYNANVAVCGRSIAILGGF